MSEDRTEGSVPTVDSLWTACSLDSVCRVSDPIQVCRALAVGQTLSVQRKGSADKDRMTTAGWVEEESVFVLAPRRVILSGGLRINDPVVARFVSRGLVCAFTAAVDGLVAELDLLVLTWPEAIEIVALTKQPRIQVLIPARFNLNSLGGGQGYPGLEVIITDLSNSGCQISLEPTPLLKGALAPGLEGSISFPLTKGLFIEKLGVEVKSALVQAGKMVAGLKFRPEEHLELEQIAKVLETQLNR